MNENTHFLLTRDYFNIPEREWGSMSSYEVYHTISDFTLLDKHEREFAKRQNKLLDYITYNKSKLKYEYKKEDIIFDFIMISDYFNGDIYKYELLSEERYSKCHTMAIKMAEYFENSKILTGYITLLDSKIMHSVLEFKMLGEVVIMDWTLNLIMEKQQYLKLTNFKVINIVQSSMIKEDEDLIYNSNITNKIYLLFRDELKRNFDKIKRQTI